MSHSPQNIVLGVTCNNRNIVRNGNCFLRFLHYCTNPTRKPTSSRHSLFFPYKSTSREGRNGGPFTFPFHPSMPISSSSPHLSSQTNIRPRSSFSPCLGDQPLKKPETSSNPYTMRPQEDHKKVPNGSSAKKERGVRYRECRKNHAANIGGYALDGCREFMASGEEGTSAALKCAACNCHRNFHKKEVENEDLLDCSSNSTSRR